MQDTVETEILGLTNYLRNSKESLLIAECTIGEDEDRQTPNEYKKRTKNERKTVDTKTNTWTIYQANNE